MQPLVEVSNLTKRYQGIKVNGVVKPALDQLTLNLNAGKSSVCWAKMAPARPHC